MKKIPALLKRIEIIRQALKAANKDERLADQLLFAVLNLRSAESQFRKNLAGTAPANEVQDKLYVFSQLIRDAQGQVIKALEGVSTELGLSLEILEQSKESLDVVVSLEKIAGAADLYVHDAVKASETTHLADSNAQLILEQLKNNARAAVISFLGKAQRSQPEKEAALKFLGQALSVNDAKDLYRCMAKYIHQGSGLADLRKYMAYFLHCADLDGRVFDTAYMENLDTSSNYALLPRELEDFFAAPSTALRVDLSQTKNLLEKKGQAFVRGPKVSVASSAQASSSGSAATASAASSVVEVGDLDPQRVLNEVFYEANASQSLIDSAAQQFVAQTARSRTNTASASGSGVQMADLSATSASTAQRSRAATSAAATAPSRAARSNTAPSHAPSSTAPAGAFASSSSSSSSSLSAASVGESASDIELKAVSQYSQAQLHAIARCMRAEQKARQAAAAEATEAMEAAKTAPSIALSINDALFCNNLGLAASTLQARLLDLKERVSKAAVEAEAKIPGSSLAAAAQRSAAVVEKFYEKTKELVEAAQEAVRKNSSISDAVQAVLTRRGNEARAAAGAVDTSVTPAQAVAAASTSASAVLSRTVPAASQAEIERLKGEELAIRESLLKLEGSLLSEAEKSKQEELRQLATEMRGRLLQVTGRIALLEGRDPRPPELVKFFSQRARAQAQRDLGASTALVSLTERRRSVSAQQLQGGAASLEQGLLPSVAEASTSSAAAASSSIERPRSGSAPEGAAVAASASSAAAAAGFYSDSGRRTAMRMTASDLLTLQQSLSSSSQSPSPRQ